MQIDLHEYEANLVREALIAQTAHWRNEAYKAPTIGTHIAASHKADACEAVANRIAEASGTRLSVIDATPLIHCQDCGAGFHRENAVNCLYMGEDWARCRNWVKCNARQRGIERPLGRQFQCGG